MDQRPARLLVKAVRSLSEQDQRILLTALFRDAIPGPIGRMPDDVVFLRSSPMPVPYGAVSEPMTEPLGPTAMLPVRLPPDLHERLRRWSNQSGFSMASVVRGLVERFLDEQARGEGRARPRKGAATRRSGTSSAKPRRAKDAAARPRRRRPTS
jgi:Arc/MetJ-type ribon-helix-helix transcriptional regulator